MPYYENGKRQTQANEEQHGQNLTQPLLHLRVLLHVPSPQFDASYLVHAKNIPRKGLSRRGMGISPGCYHEHEPICICLVPSRSRSQGEI